ncbi:CHC2 zinc finger domain-containing protein [bacterium]|nr:CHC2 zinc finger domain-containing protein [bacterium]
MTYVDFAELKENVLIQDCFDQLGLSMKSNRDAFRGPCPTCQSGGDRALVVTPSKQSFYCFGAKLGGDVIALAAHILNCDMKDAAAFLAGKGSDDTRSEPSTVPEERTKEATRSFQPLSYLEPKHHLVQKMGLDEDTCVAFGAGYAPKGILRGRLALPIHDGDGTLIAYCGKALKGEEPSLIFPKDFDAEEHLFNAHQVSGEDVILVRNPLDVLVCHQNGIENAVSVLTETISAKQLKFLAALMEKHDCNTVEIY